MDCMMNDMRTKNGNTKMTADMKYNTVLTILKYQKQKMNAKENDIQITL